MVRPELPVAEAGPEETQRVAFGRSANDFFVVHWESQDLAELEAMLRRQQLLVVHFDGQTLWPLAQCRLGAGYVPRALQLYRDIHEVTDNGRVQVSSPAASGHAKSTTRALFDYVVAGKWEATQSAYRKSELLGDCAKATHFVRSALTGAFQRAAESDGSLAGSASLGPIGAGAASDSSERLQSYGGNLQACAGPTEPGAVPACSAILRLELAAIEPAARTRVQMIGFDIAASNGSDGVAQDWDPFSKPDPKLTFVSSDGQRTTTRVFRDTSSWRGAWTLETEIELRGNTTLTVLAIDDDPVSHDDEIGQTVLDAAELSRGGQIKKDLFVGSGETGVKNGTVMLQVETVLSP